MQTHLRSWEVLGTSSLCAKSCVIDPVLTARVRWSQMYTFLCVWLQTCCVLLAFWVLVLWAYVP